MGTHWGFDENTLGTKKMKKNLPPTPQPKRKKLEAMHAKLPTKLPPKLPIGYMQFLFPTLIITVVFCLG